MQVRYGNRKFQKFELNEKRGLFHCKWQLQRIRTFVLFESWTYEWPSRPAHDWHRLLLQSLVTGHLYPLYPIPTELRSEPTVVLHPDRCEELTSRFKPSNKNSNVRVSEANGVCKIEYKRQNDNWRKSSKLSLVSRFVMFWNTYEMLNFRMETNNRATHSNGKAYKAIYS